MMMMMMMVMIFVSSVMFSKFFFLRFKKRSFEDRAAGVCVRGQAADKVDRTWTAVVCEGAGYTEVILDLPTTAVTLDLIGNDLQSVGPLSRLRHVVNLRLRDNRIGSIHRQPSATLPGACVNRIASIRSSSCWFRAVD